MPRRTSMSPGCFGLLLVCGHFVTGAAVPQEIHVRLIDIETGKPAEGLYVDLIGGIGKEAQSKPVVPPSAVPTAWHPRTDTLPPTSIDGVTRAGVYYRYGSGLKIGEISMIKVVGIYSGGVDAGVDTGVDARYVSCADQAVFQTEEVLKHGITVKNLDPGCPNKKAPGQVQAAPGEIVMFVGFRTGMPAAEIRVRLIDIETGKPVKGVDVQLRRMSPARDPRATTSADGVARFRLPVPSSREIRDTVPFFSVYLAYPSDDRYAVCSAQMSFQIEEVLKYGVTGKDVSPSCPNTKARDQVAARSGEIVLFVTGTWWKWFKKTFLLNLFQE